ncbi:MAG TPA: HEAT repeat domain-containing protein [Planctomycetota bacterium]
MKRTLALAVFLAPFAAVAQDNDPDRFKVSNALLIEGQKLHMKRNIPVALTKLKKAADKAKEEKNAKVLAEALDLTARINENLDPENIDAAKGAWEGIVADAADVQPYADRAKEKLANKGVDVWLTQLGKSLDAWRVSPDRSPAALLEKKKVAADKILALNQEAIPGLIWGLGVKDDVVRDFAADTIAEVIDDSGIAALIAKLNSEDASARSGASSALQRIYRKSNDAGELDRRASELELQLSTVAVAPESRGAAHHGKLKAEVSNLQAAAAKIRNKIPATLDTPGIQGALEKIIGDDNALPQARRDAAVAAAWIGNISGPLTAALIKGMESKDRNVREACCRAAGAVNTALSEDKHKLADVLIKNLQYEPAKDENKAEASWANDESVRQACAEAMSRIALVKTLPALIEALDDNDARVRKSAFEALSAITRRDLETSKDEKTNLPKTYEPDAPLKDRREAQGKWKEWWDATKGIVVLVERFHTFQSGWRDLSVLKLFEPPAFLKEIDSRKWVFGDPKAVMDRAERVVKDFQAKKDVYVQDAVDLGPEALEHLLKFIGGETERETKPSAGTRYFVAEAIAKSIEKNSGDVGKVRDLLGAGDAPKKIGAAICLGFISKAKIGGPERAALQDQGLSDADAEVREAAAVALGKVGEDGSAASLTKGATDAVTAVQIAALRSIALLAPKNPDTVKALGDLIADEPDVPGGASKKSQNAGVREAAVDALGAIADPASIAHLLRARRDNQRQVYEAARTAIPKVYAAGKDAARDELLKVLKDERRKTDDRGGAALTIGDSGDVDAGKTMSEQLIDMNAPRVLKDQDAEVRMRICAGLGGLKAKSKPVVDRLLQCMADEEEREAVRNAAYRALGQIFELNPSDPASPDKDKNFDASNPKDKRSAAIQAWVTFVNGQSLSQ